MTLRLTFGIDPGLSGAVAALVDGEPGPILDMPTVMHGDWNEVDGRALAAWLRGVRQQHPGAYVSACMEKVSARPDDGGTSAFRFGESSGKVKAVLEAMGIPYARVVPASWKKRFGLIKAPKDASRQLALVRFPRAAEQLTLKKHDGRAEALLIALWHESTTHGARAA